MDNELTGAHFLSAQPQHVPRGYSAGMEAAATEARPTGCCAVGCVLCVWYLSCSTPVFARTENWELRNEPILPSVRSECL